MDTRHPNPPSADPDGPRAALPAKSNKKGGPRDGTLLSRYECKYIVDEEQAELVRRFMEPFVKLDAYAAREPKNRYRISSLYLDSRDLALYRMNEVGYPNRYKLRVRTYSDDPAGPVFFEVKRRVTGIVHKVRARTDRATAEHYLETVRADGRPAPPCPLPGAEEFTRLVGESNALSAMRVKYLREAWESTGGDPVRITFDTNLERAVTPDGSLSIADGDWRATPLGGIVLEIKFTNTFPGWVQSMVDTLELERGSCAKYALSVADALEDPALRRSLLFN